MRSGKYFSKQSNELKGGVDWVEGQPEDISLQETVMDML